jgi:hypothetical protein
VTGPGTRFPSSVDALDAELMSDVLAEQSPGVRVERLQIVRTDECGDGFASTADRVVLDLEYAAGHDAGLPRRMLLKTMLATPHAPEAMYSNEVRFYREVRPALDIETPAVYASLFDPDSGQFGVAMEDLRERSASFPNATTPVGVDQIRGLVETLAGLHAAYWQSPRFASDLDWLATPCSGGMYPIFKGFGYELISDQLAKNAFKRELIAHYLDRLAAGGVSQPPDLESAGELHRRTVLWGLVIGWLITPPVNYGEEITRANLTRLVTAAQDLETLQALD